jgi:hypothetical protein
LYAGGNAAQINVLSITKDYLEHASEHVIGEQQGLKSKLLQTEMLRVVVVVFTFDTWIGSRKTGNQR